MDFYVVQYPRGYEVKEATTMNKFPNEVDQLNQALWLLMEFPINRYLMSVTFNRWSGAEKAERHQELCKIYLAVRRIITLDEVLTDYYDNGQYQEVHAKTQELTDHLDEVIGFPLDDILPDYDYYAPLFFNKFMELADTALISVIEQEKV